MKIVIINPNSSTEMTTAIQETADQFVKGDYEVICLPTPGAPAFIDTQNDEVQTAPGMAQLVEENMDTADAFVIACHYDPHLDALKALSPVPVIGMGEASMRVATMLGHNFTLLTTDKPSIPLHQALIKKYNLHRNLASIRAPENHITDNTEREHYLRLAKQAVAEDMAEVIVLGCAGMTGLDKYLQNELKIPVLDGVVCALFLAAGLVKYSRSQIPNG